MKPNDKPDKTESAYEDPKLYVVIDGKPVAKPGLETAFVDIRLMEDIGHVANDSDPDKKYAAAIVCACNKVRSISCGCVKYTPSSSGTRRSSGGCRCAPVH